MFVYTCILGQDLHEAHEHIDGGGGRRKKKKKKKKKKEEEEERERKREQWKRVEGRRARRTHRW